MGPIHLAQHSDGKHHIAIASGVAAVSLLFPEPSPTTPPRRVLRSSPTICPTSCRSTGVGLGSSIGRVGSIVAPPVTITLLDNCLQKEAVFVIVLALFIAGVACTFFPLETKGREMD